VKGGKQVAAAGRANWHDQAERADAADKASLKALRARAKALGYKTIHRRGNDYHLVTIANSLSLVIFICAAHLAFGRQKSHYYSNGGDDDAADEPLQRQS
jgi:hypothetical protein